MKFNLTISEEGLNTILTALHFEQARAESEGNNENLTYINRAINEIDNNTYVANIKEM